MLPVMGFKCCRLRHCSKLVERSLFAIIYLLQGAKSICLFFIWPVGDDFH